MLRILISLSIFAKLEVIITVLDNYASAKSAFLHPSKVRVWKNSDMPNDRPLLKGLITNFVNDVSHLSGDIFRFKI